MTMNIFVVQEHHSEGKAGLHWDFLLQVEDTLRSWALRKPPPTTVRVKHLTILVDNHSLSWADFHRQIVQGYGRGFVTIWDKGPMLWEFMTDQLIFILYGKKMTEKYILIPFEENFLLYKLN